MKNYDGSWTEWGNLVGAPVERGAPKEPRHEARTAPDAEVEVEGWPVNLISYCIGRDSSIARRTMFRRAPIWPEWCDAPGSGRESPRAREGIAGPHAPPRGLIFSGLMLH